MMLEFFKVVTFFGSVLFVGVVAVLFSIWLFINKKKSLSYLPTLALIVEESTSYILKNLIARPRPPYPRILEDGYSFPSGHTVRSTVIFILIALILSQIKHDKKFTKWLLPMALIAVILIAFSRVYLGVHYPSDVIGGVAIGGIIVLFFRILLKSRGKR